MPFNIVDSLNSAADGVLGSKFLYAVANSPIYTALIITIIVVVISIICTKFTSGSMLAVVARTLFWTFVAVTLILLLHDRIILHQAEEVHRSGNYAEFMNAAPRGIVENGAVLPPGVIPVGDRGYDRGSSGASPRGPPSAEFTRMPTEPRRAPLTPENFAL